MLSELTARPQTRTLVDGAWIAYGRTVSVKDLSEERRAWLLAIEDPTFDRHRGVDLTSPGPGMTTITQGLVKLIYFPEGFKPGIAKIRQTLIAQYALDATISKEEQLSLFLSLAYFGGKVSCKQRKKTPRYTNQFKSKNP